MQLADAGALRQTRTLVDLQHQHTDAARRLPRKLLAKTVAQMAVNKGDSAAQLAQRVTDTYVRSIVSAPALSPSSSLSSPPFFLFLPFFFLFLRLITSCSSSVVVRIAVNLVSIAVYLLSTAVCLQRWLRLTGTPL